MIRSPDGTWTHAAELPDGEHVYTFRMVSRSSFAKGQQVDIPDPCSRQVNADRNATVLRLPPHMQAETYAWKHDQVPHPGHDRLAIYELYVQDFPGGTPPGGRPNGTFDQVSARLDHISGLGFTVVELMPLMQAGGWGYAPAFFHAVEPRFGDEHGLCHLVDEAHARGMAVFFDGVYNHASTDCPLAHIDHDCYFHHVPSDPNQAWGPQFNYALNIPGTTEYPARRFIKNKVAHWIHVYHFDGIRYDAVGQIEDRAFIRELVDWTRDLAGAKPFFSIAECLPVDHAMVGPQGLMDACWNDPFAHRMRSLLAGAWDGDALRRCLDCRRDGFLSGHDVVNYLSSHDLGHTMRYLLDHGLDEPAALFRMRLGFIVLMTSVGIPMVWMGDEFGAMDPATSEPHPLDWKLLDDPRRHELCDLVRGLLHLRADCGALRGDACAELLYDDERRLLVVHRWDDAGGRIIIAIHAGDGEVACEVAAPADGAWHEHTLDFTHATNATEAEPRLRIELGGWQGQVFVHRPPA